VPCEALPDGMTVRVEEQTAFEPDAVVYCGPRIDGDAVEVPSPVIIVEVLSPGSRSLDLGSKLYRY
jgi:Uma2 family endonuclease